MAVLKHFNICSNNYVFAFTATEGDVQRMSPALYKDDGLSARFEEGIIRREVTPVKRPFEVPICIVGANKRILPPL